MRPNKEWSVEEREEAYAKVVQDLGGRNVSVYEVVEEIQDRWDVEPTEIEEALHEALMDGLVYHSGSKDEVSAIS